MRSAWCSPRRGKSTAAFSELVRAAWVASGTGEVIELAWACLDLVMVAGRAGRVQEAVDAVLEIAGQARGAGLERAYGGLLESSPPAA